ncbi:hypothetical protein [Romboutsia weinsteinii]|uniref:hypothetical protein n=1 Tax=Romboutsia weinsteinii TaxID=2020949 RepID=UPI001314CC92|nr:hypothetical protein [Romboutsia weinsteinii]
MSYLLDLIGVNYSNWEWISWAGLIYSVFLIISIAYYFGEIAVNNYRIKKFHQ